MSTFYNPNQVLYNVYDNTNKALQVEIVSGGSSGTQYTDGGTPPTHPVGNALVFGNSGTWNYATEANGLPVNIVGGSVGSSATYGAAFPNTGTPVGFTDGTNMRPAYVAAFHNSDFQVPAAGQYGILSGGVAQIYDPGGFLDRQRGTGADGIPAVGVATGAQQMAGPAITTTFGANVTGNTSAQSVQVASSTSAKVGDVILTQDNPEYVTITAIADGTHVTGIFKNNHTSGQTLTWYHYNQARDATAGDAIALTGMSASVSYLVNNITSTAEQERSAAGELDGATGRGTNIAAGYEWNAGGPYNGTAPSGNQFERERSIQAKGLGSGSIFNNPLAAASNSLTLNSAPTTLLPGQQIILDRAGANPEANYVGTGYTAGSTTVPLQVATAFSHAQNSTVEWDQFSALGPGTNGFLGAGLGIDDDVHYDPSSGKYYGDIAATADANAQTSLPLRAIGVYNGITSDRLKGINGAAEVAWGAPANAAVTWTTATALNTASAQNSTNYATATVTVVETGTTTTAGALTFEVYDGANWSAIAGQQANTLNPPVSTYTLVNNTNAQFSFEITGYQQFRVRLSTAITGTGSPQAIVTTQLSGAPSTIGDVVGLGQTLDSTNDAISAYIKGSTYNKLTASGTAISGACVYYGWTCEASSSGTLIVYDNTAASGNTIGGGTAVPLVAGSSFLLPQPITVTTGVYGSIGGTATVNLLTRNVSK